MSKKINLKDFEKKAYTSFHQDGFIDIFVGLSFIMYSIVMFTEKIPFISFCWMPALLIIPLKNRITIPRLGYVSFKQTKKVRMTKTALIVLITGHAIFLLAFIKFSRYGILAWVDENLFIILGLMVAIIPFIGAFKTGIKRFYIYAVLIFIVFALERFSSGTAPYSFGIFGLLLFFSGLIVLMIFINKYPKSGLEDENGE